MATDKVHSDTPAIDDQSKMDQFLLEEIVWCVMHMESMYQTIHQYPL